MITISIKDDFDLEKIQKSGQCFRVCNSNEGWFRFVFREDILFIREAANGKFEVSCTREKWNKVWAHYFDLKRNYSEIRLTAENADGFIKTAAQFGQGLRILRQDPWEMLITFIISQRKSIPAIATSVERLCEAFGKDISDLIPSDFKHITFFNLAGKPVPHEVFAFPTAMQLAHANEDELRKCGLGYRASYVLRTSQMVATDELSIHSLNKLSDAALFEALKKAPGVGDKVANCVCLFGFNRCARVPVDVWIERVIQNECAGKNPFISFGDNAGIMQQYAFYYMTQASK